MPWDVTLVANIDPVPETLRQVPDDLIIGTLQSVQQLLEESLPGLKFHIEPAGAEKLAMMEQNGFKLPDVIRSNMLSTPATVQAVYEGIGFFIVFFFYDHKILSRIDLEIRGSGNPIPALHSVACHTGWLFYENASGTRLKLSDDDANARWKGFQNIIRSAVKKMTGG
jgi:hypothetical protein